LDPVPCPQGTYRDDKGAKDIDDCDMCPSGYYCPHPELGEDVGTVDPIQCVEGTSCEEGSPYPRTCPAGYFCTIE
jgi:hypothetical protein